MVPPKMYTEIRQFTGMTGFFRQFIKGYSKIAKPLNDLLEGEASRLKSEELELMPEALKVFEGIEDEMHDGTCIGLRRFQETVPPGD